METSKPCSNHMSCLLNCYLYMYITISHCLADRTHSSQRQQPTTVGFYGDGFSVLLLTNVRDEATCLQEESEMIGRSILCNYRAIRPRWRSPGTGHGCVATWGFKPKKNNQFIRIYALFATYLQLNAKNVKLNNLSA